MKTTIYFPQPVEVECDDTPFYDMIEQTGYKTLSETEIKTLITAAPSYLYDLKWNALAEMPPLMPDDIVLFCQKEIMKRLIEKYQL